MGRPGRRRLALRLAEGDAPNASQNLSPGQEGEKKQEDVLPAKAATSGVAAAWVRAGSRLGGCRKAGGRDVSVGVRPGGLSSEGEKN